MATENKNLSDAIKEVRGKQAAMEVFGKFNELMKKRKNKTPFEVACEELEHSFDSPILADVCSKCKIEGAKCSDCYKAYFVAVAGVPDGWDVLRHELEFVRKLRDTVNDKLADESGFYSAERKKELEAEERAYGHIAASICEKFMRYGIDDSYKELPDMNK